MAQQAPKVAGNVFQKFLNNLKSKEFREYLMRLVKHSFIDGLYKQIN